MIFFSFESPRRRPRGPLLWMPAFAGNSASCKTSVLKVCYYYAIGCLLSFTLHAAPQEIVLWHAMAGTLGEVVNDLATQFNQSQSEFVVKPIYKGSYIETLTAYAAAYRAHAQPALVQVFEVGRSTMVTPHGLIKPVSQLYSEQGLVLNQSDFWPSVLQHYEKDGELLAMPFNISFPVMYYNTSRIHTENFPETWEAFDALLAQLKQQGETCPYTSAYPSWIHVESYMALQGERSLYQLKTHLTRLKRWQKAQQFTYAGRTDEATTLFTSGKCVLFSQSSGAYQGLQAVAPFKVGVALIPAEVASHRFTNVVGGGALWVSQGQSPQVERGIVAFFQFFMQPKVQSFWARKTGYLPILRQVHPDSVMSDKVASEWKAGERPFIPFAAHRIRGMNDEVLELLFADLIQVDEALARLASITQTATWRFEKNHGLV